jgi:hypothetical protein
VVLAVAILGDRRAVVVAPITHTQPRDANDGVELPLTTKRRLGLDQRRSWILSTELNHFLWPGPDLRPISRDQPETFAFGSIPGGLLQALRKQIVAHGRTRIVDR